MRSEISDLKSKAERICRQLAAWAKSLQQSDIKSQRHLTDRSKQQYVAKNDAETLMKDLREQHDAFIQNLTEKRKLEKG